jgi:hypothetical protein
MIDAALRLSPNMPEEGAIIEMKRPTPKKTTTRRPWSKDDVRMLKTLVGGKTKPSVIARKLERTKGATRQKAAVLNVRLGGSGLTKKAKSR